MQRFKQVVADIPLSEHIGRGIERETLRIQPDGHLAQTPHRREAWGSNLTHPLITTDYAENLLEFVTPVTRSHEQLMASLLDIHHYTMSHMKDELLWPMSMPCLVESQDDIPLAQYGSSNVGVMKNIYRRGLKHRYGSTMQIIAGIHYNFSMPDDFWPRWQTALGDTQPLTDFISEQYMGLIRNFYRFGWIIAYWFGASPALCESFLNEQESTLKFEKIGKGTLYLPYATSLRMSDLGYTSSAHSDLEISYNSLPEYIQGVRKACQTPSAEFATLPVKENGEYYQLNQNILQIENELYAPIRAKRVAESGQTPSQALHDKGIEYVEVRLLDVNPFMPQGVSSRQLQFIDAFLLWCLVEPSAPFSGGELKRSRDNLNQVALYGRDPQLELTIDGHSQLATDYIQQITENIRQFAPILGPEYVQAVDSVTQRPPLAEQVLSQLVTNDEDNGEFALELARQHALALEDHKLTYWSQEQLDDLVTTSLHSQLEIEQNDSSSLDDYLQDYFKRAYRSLDDA